MYKAPNIHLFSILTLLILSFALTIFSRDSNNKTTIIDGDGSGHYAWLPSIFIYKTLDFTSVFEAEKIRRGPDYQGHNYHKVNKIIINKFPPGTAFLIMPFFLLALLISSLFGLSLDGYNLVFQYSVGIAALFWAFVGLVYAYKLLLTYQIKTKQALFVVLASFFGTNLFAYTFYMPAFSHVYSFALISMLLYSVRIYFLNNRLGVLLLSSFLFGLVAITRSVNILVILFIPFLASNINTLIAGVKNKLKNLNIVFVVVVFVLAIMPYLFINHIQTGHYLFFSYQNEGFYWDRPEVFNFLFSFRKGWFVYTPFLVLIIPALIRLFRKNKFEFTFISLFLVVVIYVFSSWWNWFYGDSFGMRPMVDFTAIFILIIALLFKDLKDTIKTFTLIFIFIAIALNFVQTYQYSKGIIHPDSMNYKAYSHVFLKTSSAYSGSISGGPEYYYGHMNENAFYSAFNDFEKEYPAWAKLWNPETKIVYSGNKSVILNSTNKYSPSLNWILPDSLLGSNNIYVNIESMVFEPSENTARNALFVMDIQNSKGETIFYKKANIKQLADDRTNEWNIHSTGFKLPTLGPEHHLIKIYVWNTQGENFFMDDFKIGFHSYE